MTGAWDRERVGAVRADGCVARLRLGEAVLPRFGFDVRARAGTDARAVAGPDALALAGLDARSPAGLDARARRSGTAPVARVLSIAGLDRLTLAGRTRSVGRATTLEEDRVWAPALVDGRTASSGIAARAGWLDCGTLLDARLRDVEGTDGLAREGG